MEKTEAETNNRSVAQVEQELNQTRAYLDRTLTEIEEKFTSEHVKKYVTRRANEALTVGRELVTKYPVTTGIAATLLLAGVGFGYRRRSAATNGWGGVVQRILEEGRRRDGSMYHAGILAKHAGQQAGQAARALAHEATVQGQDVLGRGTQYAAHQATRAGHSLADAREHQPLLSGLVLGAVLAALGRRIL